jgi:hypothetical protein
MRLARCRYSAIAPPMVAVLALLGCSNSNGTGHSQSGSTTSTTTPLAAKDLLLSASDLPAGFTVPPANPDISKLAGELSGAADDATVSPPQCKRPKLFSYKLDTSKIAILTGIKRDTAPIALTEAIAPVAPDFASIRTYTTGDCAHTTVTMKIGGSPLTQTVDASILPAPQTAADETIVVELASTISGFNKSAHNRIGVARVGNNTVCVIAQWTGDHGIDDSVFADFLTKAVAKAAKH